jgi:hypothetical protein
MKLVGYADLLCIRKTRMGKTVAEDIVWVHVIGCMVKLTPSVTTVIFPPRPFRQLLNEFLPRYMSEV